MNATAPVFAQLLDSICPPSRPAIACGCGQPSQCDYPECMYRDDYAKREIAAITAHTARIHAVRLQLDAELHALSKSEQARELMEDWREEEDDERGPSGYEHG